MTTWVLIPVKAFEQAKSRLSTVLSAAERERLARDLFVHVLEAANRARRVDQVAVVSNSEQVLAEARAQGALGLRDDDQEQGLAHVVDAALAALSRRGANRVVICMSDLPKVSPAEIDEVVAALDEADLVLAPDLSAHGTNVIAMTRPDLLRSCLGHEDSLARHRARAAELQLSCQLLRRPGLELDVDQPQDLERL